MDDDSTHPNPAPVTAEPLAARPRRKGIYVLPNLFTLAALFGGFYAVVMAMNGRFDLATTGISNTEALGRVLYTDYLFYFEVSGLILLIAMIGATSTREPLRPAGGMSTDRSAAELMKK